MIIPSFLQKGDTIGIVSIASKIDKEVVDPAIVLLLSLGYRVKIAEHTFAKFYQYSSTDENRAADLQSMLDDQDIKAIFCSRGGYGTIRTLELIDFQKFIQHPKWIVGFSDITVLHSKLNILGFASVHGVMPRYFLSEGKPSPSFNSMLDAITGVPLNYYFPSHPLSQKGNVTGQLVGGNLSMLYSVRGTPYDMNMAGKILFIEDLGEYLYHLDRMMMNLKTSGILKNLSGLMVGNFTGMKEQDEPFGKNVEEIILDAVKEYNYPVAFQFPAGHAPDNFALKLGLDISIEITDSETFVHQN